MKVKLVCHFPEICCNAADAVQTEMLKLYIMENIIQIIFYRSPGVSTSKGSALLCMQIYYIYNNLTHINIFQLSKARTTANDNTDGLKSH